MRRAEQLLIDTGSSVEALMAKAGKGAAQEIWRISGDMPTLILCGPGNNGGDGYVIAQWLLDKGVDVSVAYSSDPKTDAAKKAKLLWKGSIEAISDASPKPQIVDCLFGTGLKRALDKKLLNQLNAIKDHAKRLVAIDLPSGVDSDTGQLLNPLPNFDLTIALGAYKPAHFLRPSRSSMGNLIGVDIGIESKSSLHVIEKPAFLKPSAIDHKYSRGLIAIIAGAMPGAANLAALAAQNSGAGYVKIFASDGFQSTHSSIVVENFSNPKQLADLLTDQRINSVVVGPGLGCDEDARKVLDQVLLSDKKLVLDADALILLGAEFSKAVAGRKQSTIATPHSGEFGAILDGIFESKIHAARQLSKQSTATILLKGSDTVIAEPSGMTVIASSANKWLSTAGTGDVLSGIIAARMASSGNELKAASAGNWLHTRAAQLAGAAFSPEKLIDQIPNALAECL